jgi:hypothetical protein
MNLRNLSAMLLFSFAMACGTIEGVADRTLDPDNVIHNYEWFHDTSEAIEARLPQIADYVQYIADETDPAEKQRLRTELNAMRQSCRSMVSDYNANSKKVNVSMFKGRTAPASYSLSICD